MRNPRRESRLDWARRRSADDEKCKAAAQRADRWLGEAPAELVADLLPRLADPADEVSDGAFFELYLFAVLNSLRPHVEVSLAPPSASGSKPDFALRLPDGRSVFVEATTYSVNHADEAEAEVVSDLFAEITRHVRTTGYCVGLEEIEPGTATASARRLAKLIDDWLSHLDRAALVGESTPDEQLDAMEEASTWVRDSASGWGFRLSPIALKDSMMKPDRLLGVQTIGDGFRQLPWKVLRTVLDRKRKQHPSLKGQLVIAACCLDMPGDPSAGQVAEALFGTTAVSFSPGRPPSQPYRLRDGFWTRRPEDNGVLGVISTSCPFPWMVPHDHMSLWINPHRTLDSVLPGWPFHLVTHARESGSLTESQRSSLTRRLGDEGSKEPAGLFRTLAQGL